MRKCPLITVCRYSIVTQYGMLTDKPDGFEFLEVILEW